MNGTDISSSIVGLVLLLGSPSIGCGRGPEPPQVEGNSMPVDDSSVLDEISRRMISGLKPERDASPTLLAGNQLRRIVIELAARGHGDGEMAAIAALDAIRLSEAIGGLTRRIERLDRSGELFGEPPRRLTVEERRSALERLETFHRIALDELRRRPCSSIADLDETMSLVLAPIRDAIETVELLPLQNHWPRRAVVVSDQEDSPETDSSPMDGETKTRVAVDLDRLGVLPGLRERDVERLQQIGVIIEALQDHELRDRLREHRAAIIEIAVRPGSFDPGTMDRQLQATARRIERRHHRFTEGMIDDLDRMSEDRLPPGESAMVRLMAAASAADDLLRLQRTSDLVAKLTRVRPDEERDLLDRMRRLTRNFADDRTRSTAALDFDRIDDDLDRFVPLPIEVLLVDPNDRLEELVAGRSADLALRIDQTRRAWVAEISTGETNGPNRRSLLDLERLGKLLVDVDAMAVEDPDIVRRLEISNRWSGWYVPTNTIGWAARTITPGLRLAAVAACEGDFARLSRDLERLERQAPPARLVAWLSSNLETPLAMLDGGSVGALASVALPPSTTAWGVEHRVALARICRGFAEITAARQRGDATGVDHLSRWVTRACDDLLEDVSSLPSPPAAKKPHHLETDG